MGAIGVEDLAVLVNDAEPNPVPQPVVALTKVLTGRRSPSNMKSIRHNRSPAASANSSAICSMSSASLSEPNR